MNRVVIFNNLRRKELVDILLNNKVKVDMELLDKALMELQIKADMAHLNKSNHSKISLLHQRQFTATRLYLLSASRKTTYNHSIRLVRRN
jgi:hypothetical protein